MRDLPKHLVYASDEQAGYLRKRRGRGFSFFNPKGEKIAKGDLPRHLQKLYVPPAWSEVWLSPKANAHLQATGYDEQGRKQYVYHDDWNGYRQSEKFSQLEGFAEALPAIREKIHQDLQKEGWPREKVLALVVALLDSSYMRIGNVQYQKSNQTFGLTTLRRKHLKTEDSLAIFSFKGKKGVQRTVKLEDAELVGLLKECSELPGYELFRYEEGKAQRQVDSGDVNEYLREISGSEYTSKTFRTWGGTVLAVELFHQAQQLVEENPRRDLLAAVVQLTAEALGNTPAVCRAYYIHPAILDAIETHTLPQLISKSRARQTHAFDLEKTEKICLKIIKAWTPKQQTVQRQAS